jgi:hypothetical protein
MYVYLRRGKYLYFERHGRLPIRLRGEPGTIDFEREYRAALKGETTRREYKARKAVFGEFHTPDGACHFASLEASARRRAAALGREYSLPPGWAKQQYALQTGVCALTGQAFNKDRMRRAPFAPSIDRVNNKLGYTPENCQLITYIANCAKNQFTVEEFTEMCLAVAKKAGMRPKKRIYRTPADAGPGGKE